MCAAVWVSISERECTSVCVCVCVAYATVATAAASVAASAAAAASAAFASASPQTQMQTHWMRIESKPNVDCIILQEKAVSQSPSPTPPFLYTFPCLPLTFSEHNMHLKARSPSGYKLQQQSRTHTHTAVYFCIHTDTHIYMYSYTHTHAQTWSKLNKLPNQIFHHFCSTDMTASSCVCVCESASVCECMRSSLPFKGSMKCKGYASSSSMSEFDSVFPNDSVSRIRIHVRILVLHWLLGRFDWAPFKSIPPPLSSVFFFSVGPSFVHIYCRIPLRLSLYVFGFDLVAKIYLPVGQSLYGV